MMQGDDIPISPMAAQLKEKIRLKKLDRGVYINEVEREMAHNREKRNALRIGNECLRYMTIMQEEMPVRMNAEIFHNHPNEEKLPMQKTNLQDSIYINDGKLFKTGKNLLKEDFVRAKLKEVLDMKKEDLDRAIQERQHQKSDYEQKCEVFLHKQAMVSDSNHRQTVARLLYQRLQMIHKTLNDDISTYRQRLADIEKKISDKAAELRDFEDLKVRAQRFLDMELAQLQPIDLELTKVTSHFAKSIANGRNELEDRRKKSSLLKYITERESNFFSFSDNSNLMDTKVKARDKALVDAYDTLVSLMDAMMVSDVKYVVDCFLDQRDVTRMLTEEKEDAEWEHAQLLSRYTRLANNNEHLRYNDTVRFRYMEQMTEAKENQKRQMKVYESCDEALKKLDKLMSALKVSLHALFEKLRPIKIEEEFNNFQGNLVKDIQNFNRKLEKMLSVIANNTMPIGSVRPLMLHLFKNKRLPPDSIRVDLQGEIFGAGLQSYDFYEMDQPGYVSRDYLKAKAAQSGGGGKKKGKGGRKK